MRPDLKEKVATSPRLPGVYQFSDEKRVIYVGKAKDLKSRLQSYTAPIASLSLKTAQMISSALSLSYQTVGSELEALLLEARLIKKLQPKYNSIARDDKHPLYIKITSQEYPKVLTVRLEDDQKSCYFGPFPSSGAVRSVLKTLRTVFPYCSQPQVGNRACFYSHLGLCRPCPSEIVKMPEEEKQKHKKIYRQNISHIKGILSGRIGQIVTRLEKEMAICAAAQDYEKAALIRDKISHLKYIIQRPLSAEQIIASPNLPEDKARDSLAELTKSLKGNLPQLNEIHLIECYDIANIQGQSAVGSQITFLEGVPEKSLYKRYRIKMAPRPNDVGMIKEMLRRRLGHSEWTFPELIVIDGGKPQVSAALKVLGELGLKIPVIGLAKREEEIIIPNQDGFTSVRLERTNAGLQLLKHLRDEAHRFGQRYYHLLMKKRLLGLTLPS